MLLEVLAGARRFNVRTAYWLIIFSVVAMCVAVRQADPGFMARLRLLGFDLLQQSLPRSPDANYPVRIVDIDERSIKTFGNWPWRRDLLARLIDKLVASGARVVVFDMVFPDPSTGPLDQLPEALRNSPDIRPLLSKLAEAETLDDIFAKAIARHPTVLGIIGTSQASPQLPKVKASFATIGDRVEGFARNLPGASGNLAAFEDAAAGVGALNWFPDHDQILRRIPLVVTISNRLYPSLITETLRVFYGTKTLRVRSAGDGGFAGDRGITTVAIGDTVIPTDQDGQLWLSFSRRDPKRTISAADVLQDSVSKTALDGRIAIIGTSAPGLLDLRATPLDPVISGVEINALALEQLLSKRLLVRPDFAVGMEIVAAVASALLLGLLVYRWGARVAAAVGFAHSLHIHVRQPVGVLARHPARCGVPRHYEFGGLYLRDRLPLLPGGIGTQPRARDAAAHRQGDGSGGADPAHLPAQGGPARTVREQVRDLRGHEARQGHRRRLLRLLPDRR